MNNINYLKKVLVSSSVRIRCNSSEEHAIFTALFQNIFGMKHLAKDDNHWNYIPEWDYYWHLDGVGHGESDNGETIYTLAEFLALKPEKIVMLCGLACIVDKSEQTVKIPGYAILSKTDLVQLTAELEIND